jgi:hypothetical protein
MIEKIIFFMVCFMLAVIAMGACTAVAVILYILWDILFVHFFDGGWIACLFLAIASLFAWFIKIMLGSLENL